MILGAAGVMITPPRPASAPPAGTVNRTHATSSDRNQIPVNFEEPVNMPQLLHARIGVTVRLLCPAGEATAGGQGVQVLRAGHPLAHGQQLGVIAARVEIYPTGVSGASISASAVPEPTTRH